MQFKNIVLSKDFCTKHKQNLHDFSRTRLFPFQELIFFLMNMNNKSYQNEFDRYFQVIKHAEIPERIMFTMHAMNAAKRIFRMPDFRYYALADGISAIFKRIGKGLVHSRGHKPEPSPQLSLWWEKWVQFFFLSS